MTVVGVERDGDDRTITYHDPGASDGINQQSTFTATTKNAPLSTIWSVHQASFGRAFSLFKARE